MDRFFSHTNSRLRFGYGAILFICAIFVLRLFYVQVIRYSYYQEQAQASQLRKYEIPAERGIIYAQDGGEQVPLVLNELRYSIVADPQIIEDKEATADRVAEILNVSEEDVLQQLSVEESRYEILAKNQPKEIKEAIETAYYDGDIVGVFAERTVERIYPQGDIAAQVLGFVDDEGVGQYGIEQALNDDLDGIPGRLKALTDQDGIPLLASGDNIQQDPVDGTDILLTIDVAMQQQVEEILEKGLKRAKSKSGNAIVIDPNSGAVRAMANYPSYKPAEFREVEDPLLYTNRAVSAPLEPGSIMKVLTTAAAIDSGSVSASQSYYDPSFYRIDDAVVRNIAEDGGAAQRTVSDILRFSLNTGATWLLMQMGGGELNEQGRKTWHEYMTQHYRLGQITGIEQGYEEPGTIPSPTEGFGLNIKYANTSFGQGMTATPLQMLAATVAVVNGGTYYQPHLIASLNGEEIPSDVVNDNVVSDETSAAIRTMMENVVNNNLLTARRDGYSVGGKTGTAEIANPAGGYFEDKFNGTYVGFVGGDRPEYALIVRVDEPKIPGYAGSQAAGPIFSDIVNTLIDNFSVPARTGT